MFIILLKVKNVIVKLYMKYFIYWTADVKLTNNVIVVKSRNNVVVVTISSIKLREFKLQMYQAEFRLFFIMVYLEKWNTGNFLHGYYSRYEFKINF